MDDVLPRHNIHATATASAKSLAHLILAEEPEDRVSYLLFARALARQLRHWPRSVQAIGEEDVIVMLKSAARELLMERRDE